MNWYNINQRIMILEEEIVEDLISETLESLNYKKYTTPFNGNNLTIVIDYIPIDVKASNIKSNNALRSYMRKHDSIGIRYTFGYLKYEDNIIHIPFYLINKTTEFIDYWIEKYKGQN